MAQVLNASSGNEGLLKEVIGSAGMQVTADLILKREATSQDAASFLAKVFEHTEQHLNGFQKMSQLVEGFVRQQGGERSCTQAIGCPRAHGHAQGFASSCQVES